MENVNTENVKEAIIPTYSELEEKIQLAKSAKSEEPKSSCFFIKLVTFSSQSTSVSVLKKTGISSAAVALSSGFLLTLAISGINLGN